MKARYWMIGVALVAQWAVADEAQPYHYGQAMDVARVISIEVPQGCEVGEATMVYEDSHGKIHTLVYLRQGENCVY